MANWNTSDASDVPDVQAPPMEIETLRTLADALWAHGSALAQTLGVGTPWSMVEILLTRPRASQALLFAVYARLIERGEYEQAWRTGAQADAGTPKVNMH